jgi:hypothetical protein
MADEVYVQSLVAQYRASLETEPWDEQLTDELLTALRQESPETYAELEADANRMIEQIMRKVQRRG